MSETRIHPTAVIDPSAEIGVGCEIGPYCVIGPSVRLGDRCRLHSHVVISGPSVIGDGNEFYPYAAIGHRTQDLKYAGEPTGLKIGYGNVFREFATVHRATHPGDSTIVGNHGHFLAYTHIAHDCVVGDHCIFSNNGTLAGHVVVEDHVILGGLTAVHQFCRLGRFSMTGGCSKIVQDVAPFVIVDGNPARPGNINKVGMERHGFSPEEIQAVKRAYRALFIKDQPREHALAALDAMTTEGTPGHDHVAHMAAFIRTSARGITA